MGRKPSGERYTRGPSGRKIQRQVCVFYLSKKAGAEIKAQSVLRGWGGSRVYGEGRFHQDQQAEAESRAPLERAQRPGRRGAETGLGPAPVGPPRAFPECVDPTGLSAGRTAMTTVGTRAPPALQTPRRRWWWDRGGARRRPTGPNVFLLWVRTHVPATPDHSGLRGDTIPWALQLGRDFNVGPRPDTHVLTWAPFTLICAWTRPARRAASSSLLPSSFSTRQGPQLQVHPTRRMQDRVWSWQYGRYSAASPFRWWFLTVFNGIDRNDKLSTGVRLPACSDAD